jgi:hypothetical protein
MNKEQDMNWQDTQKWADQKIAGLLAIAQRQGDKLIVGADPRDLLTTKEQQLELMQQQAVLLRQRMDQGRHKNTRLGANMAKKPTKSLNLVGFVTICFLAGGERGICFSSVIPLFIG